MTEQNKPSKKSRTRNDYRLIITNDPDSKLTKEDVLNSLEWFYEDILFNNDYLERYKKSKPDRNE